MAPHATDSPTPTTVTTNGTSAPSPAHSKTLSHLTSYPIVADTLSTITSHPLSTHPLSQRTISLTHRLYNTFFAPFAAYLTPYAEKADTFADSNLNKIDSKFPIMKESTENLKSYVIGFPKAVNDKVMQGKDHVLSVYEEESKKVGRARGVVSSGMTIGGEAWGVVSGYLGRGSEDVQKRVQKQQ